MKKTILLLALLIGLTTVDAKKKAEYAHNWEVLTMNGNLVSGKATMKIEENGRFAGKGFCNNFMGIFTFKKSKITTDQNIISTKMMCKDMAPENEFFSTLKGVDSYEIKKGQLILKSKKQIVLVFNRVIETPDKKKSKK